MSSWIAFLVTLSVIILVHEWGHFAMARRIGVRVERFSFGFGPILGAWKRGETEYAVSLLPFGGYVKLAGESSEAGAASPKPWEYRGRSVGERMSIVFAGPLINYGLGWALFLFVFATGVPVLTTQIGEVREGYPAQAAGLRPSDRILAVGEQPVGDWHEMTRAIQAQAGPVPITVEREGRSFVSVVTPKGVEQRGLFGAHLRIGVIGITPAGEVKTQRYPPVQAFLRAGRQVWFLTSETVKALWAIAAGLRTFQESFAGPVRIFDITSAVATQGLAALLQWIAILSTCIGFFNLLPIPVLDGGHLAFLLVEKIRRRPVSQRVQEAMTQVGLAALILLLAVVTYNDLAALDWFGRLKGLFGR